MSTVDPVADSGIPVPGRPCAVSRGKGHADEGQSRDLSYEVGVTGLTIAVWTAHWLPTAGARVAVKKDQTTIIFLGHTGGPQDVVSGNGGISVDESIPRLRWDNRADEGTETGEPGRGAVCGKTKVFLTIVAN